MIDRLADLTDSSAKPVVTLYIKHDDDDVYRDDEPCRGGTVVQSRSSC